MEQVKAAITTAHGLGPRVVLVTSVVTKETPADAVDLLVGEAGRFWRVRTPRLAVSVNGAGDAIAALLILPSGRFKSWLNVVIAKNFFQHRYDYRSEWMRFADTIGFPSKEAAPFYERVVKSLADIFDSPGGLLLVPDDEGRLTLQARWNWATADVPANCVTSQTMPFFESTGHIVSMDEMRAGSDERCDPRAVPQWLYDEPHAWAVVPLVHFGKLAGLVVLARPRLPRALDWEDFDLLKVVGREAASYLAEAQGQAALSDARRFDEFNRRFAFIMHDLKNLVSQLSLVARNAERHADNPAFRADMVATLQSSVGKMNDLLARLSQREISKGDGVSVLDVDKLVAEVVASKKPGYPQLELTPSGKPVEVSGDGAQLEQMFAHLIQNAIDASVDATAVTVSVASGADEVAIAVADQGVGMTPAFLRNDLFRPFHSTKPGGFGIGAYEARTIVRNMGGQLDVASTPGEGTVFTVRLPIHHAVGRIAS